MPRRRPPPLSEEEARTILATVTHRIEDQSKLLKAAFPAQRDLILDKSRLKAALCSRRSGKSYAAGLYMCKEAIDNPGCHIIYAALTRQTCKNTMFKQILMEKINRQYKLGMTFNKSTLEVAFPNGSMIFMLGLDSNAAESEKVLGQAYTLAVIDESASFRQDLDKVVYSDLRPAMMDTAGTILLIGTPGWNTKNLFYKVTKGQEPGWSVHKWIGTDNPHMKEKYLDEIRALKLRNPYYEESPYFQQQYLGLWFEDDSNFVYKYNDDRNTIPDSFDVDSFTDKDKQKRYRFFLGIDLGYEDDTALVVLAVDKDSSNVYVVEVFKKNKLILSQIIAKIEQMRKLYPFARLVIDTGGGSKISVEEMRQKYNLPLETAEKTGKEDFIEMLNNDLIGGTVQLNKWKCNDLIEEFGDLIWDKRAKRLFNKRVEDKTKPNHACDAFLYVWRHAKHRYFKTQSHQFQIGSEEWFMKMDEEAEKKKMEMLNKPWEMSTDINHILDYDKKSSYIAEDIDPNQALMARVRSFKRSNREII